MKLDLTQPPSHRLYRSVRAVFILHGTTLGRWCKGNSVQMPFAKDALIGRHNGKKTVALRKKVIADVQALAKGA